MDGSSRWAARRWRWPARWSVPVPAHRPVLESGRGQSPAVAGPLLAQRSLAPTLPPHLPSTFPKNWNRPKRG